MIELDDYLFYDVEFNKIYYTNDFIISSGIDLKKLVSTLGVYAEYISDDNFDISYAQTQGMKTISNCKNKMRYELSKEIDLDGEISHLLQVDNINKDYLQSEYDYISNNKHNIILLKMAFILKYHLDTNSNGVYIMRGSGIASYILYVLGLNKVNPITFGLDYTDFWEE